MKKWENSSRLDGSSAIVYSTVSSFTHGSSKLLFSPCQQRLWCVCTQEEPPELRGVWTLNVNGRRIYYTLLCSLSVYLVQLIEYSSSPFGPFISSRNGIFGDGDGDGLPLANQNHTIFFIFFANCPIARGRSSISFLKTYNELSFHISSNFKETRVEMY